MKKRIKRAPLIFSWINPIGHVLNGGLLALCAFFLHEYYINQKGHNEISDRRLARIEYKLGLPPLDLSPEYSKVVVTDSLCMIENRDGENE